MQTKVSTKGQVVLPGPVRRRLGIRAGDPLIIHIEEDRIVLTPGNTRTRPAKIGIDAVTGLPVLSAGIDSPELTSKDVEEILANFP